MWKNSEHTSASTHTRLRMHTWYHLTSALHLHVKSTPKDKLRIYIYTHVRSLVYVRAPLRAPIAAIASAVV